MTCNLNFLFDSETLENYSLPEWPSSIEIIKQQKQQQEQFLFDIETLENYSLPELPSPIEISKQQEQQQDQFLFDSETLENYSLLEWPSPIEISKQQEQQQEQQQQQQQEQQQQVAPSNLMSNMVMSTLPLEDWTSYMPIKTPPMNIDTQASEDYTHRFTPFEASSSQLTSYAHSTSFDNLTYTLNSLTHPDVPTEYSLTNAPLLPKNMSGFEKSAAIKAKKCQCPNCLVFDRPEGKQSRKRLHICHYADCGKAFIKPSYLKAHLESHCNERRYLCSWALCGKKFKRSDDLLRHIKTHTGEKKFVCPHCPYRFMRKDHFKQHIMKIHENPKRHGTKRNAVSQN